MSPSELHIREPGQWRRRKDGLLIPDVVPTVARFPGDPGIGGIYMGQNDVISELRSRWQPLFGRQAGIVRLYYGQTVSWSAIDSYMNSGILPWISFKADGTATGKWPSVVNGSKDAMLTTIADAMKARAPKPIWWTFNHEPENDGGVAADYRAACRYIYNFFKNAGVTNGTHCATVLMGWTVDTNSGRDWRTWYPDWKGTGASASVHSPSDFYQTGDPLSVVDILGADHYNYYGEATMGKTWDWNYWNLVSGWSHFDKTNNAGKPYAIGETGNQVFSNTSVLGQSRDEPKTRLDLTSFYNLAINNDILAWSWWEQDWDDQGSEHSWNGKWDSPWDPNMVRADTWWNDLMARPNTKLPADLGWL